VCAVQHELEEIIMIEVFIAGEGDKPELLPLIICPNLSCCSVSVPKGTVEQIIKARSAPDIVRPE
jgi:hypothetical protein